MSHNISWDNDDQTVVLQEYTEGASKDDLYYLAEKSEQMLNTVDHTVHLIIDERRITLIITSTDMSYLEKHTPPNQGVVVVIAQRSKQTYKTAAQVLNQRFAPNAFGEPLFAETVEEARLFLQENFAVRYPPHALEAKP
jgi:hypothetical protein